MSRDAAAPRAAPTCPAPCDADAPEAAGGARTRSDLPGRLRNAATLALLAALILPARPRPASLAAGLTLVALGQAWRVWAAGYLHKTRTLITAGPYARVRNPLYLGRLTIFTGLCLAAHLPGQANLIALAAGWLVFFGYYLPRKERVEPARLLALHGESFRRYHAAVPALLPRLRRWPGAARQRWTWQRFRRNREHWMLAGLLVVAIYLALRTT